VTDCPAAGRSFWEHPCGELLTAGSEGCAVQFGVVLWSVFVLDYFALSSSLKLFGDGEVELSFSGCCFFKYCSVEAGQE